MPSLTYFQSKAVDFVEWVNPLTWLTGRSESRAKVALVVSKTENARWCWELTDDQGHVHGRSTDEFIRREQAVASARLTQFMIVDSMVTDRDGREL